MTFGNPKKGVFYVLVITCCNKVQRKETKKSKVPSLTAASIHSLQRSNLYEESAKRLRQ